MGDLIAVIALIAVSGLTIWKRFNKYCKGIFGSFIATQFSIFHQIMVVLVLIKLGLGVLLLISPKN